MWKRQPDGGLTGEGMSPVRTMRLRRRSTLGSGIGIAESSACVYGCSGFCVELVAVGELDDLADVHHRDAGRDVPHDREVVGDEEIGQPELLLQILSRLMTCA